MMRGLLRRDFTILTSQNSNRASFVSVTVITVGLATIQTQKDTQDR